MKNATPGLAEILVDRDFPLPKGVGLSANVFTIRGCVTSITKLTSYHSYKPDVTLWTVLIITGPQGAAASVDPEGP